MTDLDDRVKGLERRLGEELQALWPLRVRALPALLLPACDCPRLRHMPGCMPGST